MSKAKYTHITIILDGSHSVSGFKNGTIRGVNALLTAQAADDVTLTLIVFDTGIELRHDFCPLNNVSMLGEKSYIPRNQSALLDAIGTGIVETQESLNGLEPNEQPESIIFVIITDGYDSISSKFTLKMLKSSILAKIKDSWEFLLIAADAEDAKDIAQAMGIPKESALGFVPNEPGILLAMQSANRIITEYKTFKQEHCHFTQSDHERQQELVPKR